MEKLVIRKGEPQTPKQKRAIQDAILEARNVPPFPRSPEMVARQERFRNAIKALQGRDSKLRA